MRHQPIESHDKLRRPLSRAELFAALSPALDLAEGHREGHAVRACWIGMNIGIALRLKPAELDDLYHAILLKDLGGSANAPFVAALFRADDQPIKAEWKRIGARRSDRARFALDHAAPGGRLLERLASLTRLFVGRERIAATIAQVKGERGAALATRLGMRDEVAHAILAIEENFDGSGFPRRLTGRRIPMIAKIARLAEQVELHHRDGGRIAAMNQVARREGNWFAPNVCSPLYRLADDNEFWNVLESPIVAEHLAAIAPRDRDLLDDDYVDRVADVLGEVIDAKTRFRAAHSRRVASLAADLARARRLSAEGRRRVRRAALLKDIGFLGLSTRLVEKPMRLTDAEREDIETHEVLSGMLLEQSGIFAEVAALASARQSPLGLADPSGQLEARIVAISEAFVALTSRRPHRPALPVGHALELIEEEVGLAYDKATFNALKTLVA